jgi:tRNA dimethylallyltransferase
VGGSGFYLQAFFAPVIDEVEVPNDLRRRVLDWEQEEGLSGLLRRLNELNPEGVGDLDLDNPRRVTRALERCLASGESLLALKESFQKADFPFRRNPKITWILDREDFDLEQRVKERVSLMLDEGLLMEVQTLRKIGLERNPSACRAVGYRETLLHLDGRYSSEQWREAIVSDTLRLARKQRKWFRSRLPTDRVILLAEHEEIADLPAPWEL